MGQTLTERREQLYALRLNENLDRFNPAVASFLKQARPALMQWTGDPVAARREALQALDNLRESQALSLAYFDCFLIFAVIGVALALLVPWMKRSVLEKGARTAAE